ncbi:hypothetical protein BASA83_002899 [Batrachochytrium salamandrivorans]|nr:hypothetical protein BASA83_002899 [Batrachochytrium salamandrivorans]
MVKLKHHAKTKFQFDWKGPYHIVDVGFPGTYWLMDPQGRRFDSTVNERDLAPWLTQTDSNQEYRHSCSSSTNNNRSFSSFSKRTELQKLRTKLQQPLSTNPGFHSQNHSMETASLTGALLTSWKTASTSTPADTPRTRSKYELQEAFLQERL